MSQSINNLSQLPEEAVMYQALLNKDSTFEGVFVVGVKTTGILCRPTCRARKPKAQNVEYFHNVKQALSLGYRPCKVCHPLTPYGTPPDWLKGLLQQLETAPLMRMNDQALRDFGLEPARVRRWFKLHHGMTFQAYARALRINKAFGLIKEGDTEKLPSKSAAQSTNKPSVTETALDSGYNSLSGFNEAFKNITGQSPTQSKNNQIITITRILTPLGPMFAGVCELTAGSTGLCLLEFTDRRMLETQIKRLSQKLKARFIPGQHPLFTQLAAQLKEYFAGQRDTFSIPLALPGTDFQQAAWHQLCDIKYGETRSYQQQAEAIGRPEAVRAIAKANGDNRISIIVPCHRVIGKNGKLTGYGGGLWRKQRLLELEKGQWQS